jgi:uncharacterized protein
MSLQRISPDRVKLLPGLFQQRSDLNRKYLLSLKSENLLQNFYLEAGLWSPSVKPEEIHWGWESPTSQVRGHFLGHWLSAAARLFASTGDPEVKGKADFIVSELGRCQKENGGEWVFSIPEKYLDWIARGKTAWAPHYTIHKTLMGLVDMVVYGKNAQALEILEGAARWFHRWACASPRPQFDDILDFETGGMLEAWADLYGITRRQEHLDLVYQYDRPRLFNRLLAGEDPLTNRHANTTIPEAQGAARAYEVTGDDRWRQIAEAYWRCAVTERGTFCTGGQTAGEIWTPPFAFAARLGDKNQEHCVVYNMQRLADYLLRWTGDVQYSDYVERNLYNGILAQQNPQTGMIDYFLALRPGSQKRWGSPTHDFWCCHGSLVQAHTIHNAYVYYESEDGLEIHQYIPTELRWEWQGAPVVIRQEFDFESSASQPHLPDSPLHRPSRWVVNLTVYCERPAEFALRLRLPGWLSAPAEIQVDGIPQAVTAGPLGSQAIRKVWGKNTLRLVFPMTLTASPIPDLPTTAAFMEGPVVLAGLCDEERTLYGDIDQPSSMLAPDHEREWHVWKGSYRAVGQARGLRFIPLYEVCDEHYTVYFPIRQ